MSIDTPSIPPEGEPKKKFNWLWGCLIALVLVIVIFCCGVTLIFMPLFSESDPLGTGLRDQIEEYLPLDYLDDPSTIPGVDEILDDEFFSEGENSISETISEGSQGAEDIPLAQFHFIDIGTSFLYPMGWEVEVEGYGVTFYDPESFTYIFMGEDMIETGTQAEEIALEILDSIQAEAQEDSFSLLSSSAYPVSIAEDAHLTSFEWVDQEGYYNWAYDLEIASGESNIFLFISGESPDDITFYGDLLDLIASSLEVIPEIEEIEDA